MIAGPDTTGPILVLGHLVSILLVLGLLTVALGLGRRILEGFGLRTGDPLARISFGAAVGLSLLANAFLILGASGWLRAWSLLLVLLLAAALARREILTLPALFSGVPGFMREKGGWSPSLAWGLTVLAGVSLFLLVLGVAPPVDWDTLMYHLPVPAGFLEEGRIFLPRDNLHVSFVGLLHMLYLPLLAAGSTSAPALLNGALAVLLAVALFSMGARFLGGEVGSVGLGLIWGTTTLILVAVTPRTDVTLALFLLLAHYAFLLALEEDKGVEWGILGAALLGFAAGVKLNALAYGVGLGPLALWVAWKKGGAGPARWVRPTLSMALVGGIALAPWLLKNWALLGAPLYPYFAHRMLEPWLQDLYRTAQWATPPDPNLALTLRGVREPVSLWGVFFAPGTLTAEGEGSFYYANRFLLLLPLAVFFLRRRWVAWIALPPLLYLLAVLVPFPYTNLRYLIPAAPALTLVAAYAVLEAGSRYLPRKAAILGLLILATLSLGPSYRAARHWLEGTEALTYLSGFTSQAEFRSTHLDPGVRAYAPLIRRINGSLSADDTVLMLFEARGFPLRTRVIQDNRITNWPYLVGVLPPGSCGENIGADYLLLASAALRYYQQRGLDPERLRWGEFEEFAGRCLDPVYQVPGYVLFRWRKPASISELLPYAGGGPPGPPGGAGSRP